MARGFTPQYGEAQTLEAGTTSSEINFSGNAHPYFIVSNTSSSVGIYFRVANVTTTALVDGDPYLAPGESLPVAVPKGTVFVAAITAGGTADLNVCPVDIA